MASVVDQAKAIVTLPKIAGLEYWAWLIFNLMLVNACQV